MKLFKLLRYRLPSKYVNKSCGYANPVQLNKREAVKGIGEQFTQIFYIKNG